MEQLKKIQPYQFWILLAVALLLPVIGWFMTRGSMISAAEARKTALDDLFKKLPSGADNPNDTWTKGGKALNDQQAETVAATWQELYARQTQFMTWPEKVDPVRASPQDLERYRQVYKSDNDIGANKDEIIDSVWRIVEPNFEDQVGKVDFPFEKMPSEDFGNLPPTPVQMKNAQEDVWLLTSLFRAIARVNETATNQANAPLRKIYTVRLLGGGGAKPSAAAAGVPGAPPAAGAQPGMPPTAPPTGGASHGPPATAMSGAAFGGGLGGFGSGLMGKRGDSGVDFNPADEFGSDEDKSGGAANPAAGAAKPPAPGATPAAGHGPPPGAAGMGNGMMGAPTGPKKRYVEEKPAWKTRGFYLKVAIHQGNVPDLLVSLANSEWPLRVTRVHQMDLNPEVLGATDAGGPGFRPGPGPGSGPGPGPGSEAMAAMMKMRQGAPGAPNADSSDLDSGTVDVDASAKVAMSDPMLAIVAISGLFTIFNEPPAVAAAPGQVNGQPASAGTAPPATAPPAAILQTVPTQPAGQPPATNPGVTNPAATVPASTPASPNPAASSAPPAGAPPTSPPPAGSPLGGGPAAAPPAGPPGTPPPGSPPGAK